MKSASCWVEYPCVEFDQYVNQRASVYWTTLKDGHDALAHAKDDKISFWEFQLLYLILVYVFRYS